MDNIKYTLVDFTEEEQNAFLKDFNDLLTKYQAYYEPVPNFTRPDLFSPWQLVCQVLLKKKVPKEDEPKEQTVPSPFENKDKSDESPETTS